MTSTTRTAATWRAAMGRSESEWSRAWAMTFESSSAPTMAISGPQGSMRSTRATAASMVST